MKSYFLDLIRDAERIKKSLLDQASRIVKSAERAKLNPNKAAANLEKAAQAADRWIALAKSKNVEIDQRHYTRMAEISKTLRVCAEIKNHKKQTRMVETAIQELRQVINNSKK